MSVSYVFIPFMPRVQIRRNASHKSEMALSQRAQEKNSKSTKNKYWKLISQLGKKWRNTHGQLQERIFIKKNIPS